MSGPANGFRETLTNNPGCVSVKGSFVAAGATTLTSQVGKGVTVTYGGSAGRYLLTLDRKYLKLVGCTMLVSQTVSVARLTAHIQDQSALKSAGTITIEARVDAGTATALAAADVFYYEFQLDMTGLV